MLQVRGIVAYFFLSVTRNFVLGTYILDFNNFKILTAHTLRIAKMHHHAKFFADRSRHCGDMAVFDFSRWRPSAILDF